MRLILRPNGRQLGLVVALEQICCYVPPRDFAVIEGEGGIVDRPADHLIWVREMVLVVTIGTPERGDGCNRIGSPPSASCALLVVRSRWWHVPQRHAGERPDVDAYLHRRRA